MFKLFQKAETATTALPALLARSHQAVSSITHGDHARRKVGSGEKFWQFRNYTPYDRPQDIDWRQSAKGDHVYIRQKEWQTAQTALFWCSNSQGMDFCSPDALTSKADAAHILSLSLALLLTRAGEQVGMIGQSRTGRSSAALERIANALLNPKKECVHFEQWSVVAQSKTPSNALLIQISDFLEPLETLKAICETLAAQSPNALIIQVLDPHELELPYLGRVLFQDPASDAQELINNVPSIRAKYQMRIQSHIRAFQELCTHYGWHYILHRTDTPLEDTLADIWAILDKHGRHA